MKRSPRVVRKSELVELPNEQTAGMHRGQAFATDEHWVGLVRTEPGEWSGWHHHGDHETYFYVLKGRIELEFRTGDDDATIGADRSEFAHVPSRLVHRERTAPGEPGEIILVRIGHGPTVVNVDDPGA